MEPSKNVSEQMEVARGLEKEGRFSDAAAIYQKLFNKDPTSQPVVERILVLYRKLKDYPKELSVLDDALAAIGRRQQDTREKWIKSHPQAASAGRSILRQLEKSEQEGLIVDPQVGRWMKRRELVAARISGKKGKLAPGDQKKKRMGQKKITNPLHVGTTVAKKKPQQTKKAAKTKKKVVEKEMKLVALQRKEERERKAAEAARKKEEREHRKAEAEQRKAEAARRKAEADRQRAEKAAHPSLFIVMLNYLVSLEKIDEAMNEHVSYLSKHFANSDFLVAGRQVPRTGGVILARGKSKASVERIVRQDPFVKRKLARPDIIEFTSSQVGKGLAGWLKGENKPFKN